MVMHHAYERNHVGAWWQRVGVEIAAMKAGSLRHSGSAESRPGQLHHRWQVEELQAQLRVPLAGRLQEGTGTAADVHQDFMP